MTDRIIQYHSERFNSEINSDVSMITDKEKQLILLALNKEWTNPKFKLKWFVGQAQITPYSKFRQWLLEIKGKEEAIENLEYEIAKMDVEYEKFQRIKDNVSDDLDKRMAEIEMWNTDRKRYTTKRRLQDWYLERQHLIDLLNEFLESDEAKLPDGSGRTYMDILNTDEEDKYEQDLWTNRLAKQAACDLMFYGRINSGNMDAILSMSPEQQAETLTLAVTFGSKLQNYQAKLQMQVDEQLKLDSPTDVKSLLFPTDTQDVNKLHDTNQDRINVYNI